MRNLLVFITIPLMIIIFPSCDDNSISWDISFDCPILFSNIYVNRAWGYQYSGWYIDLEGQRYDFDENLEPKIDIAHQSAISEEILSESLKSATRTDRYLDQSILSEAIDLLKKAYKGSLSDPETMCFDFGTNSYFAFIRDQKGDTCRSILLYQAADSARKNLDPEAIELFELLREHVDNDTSQLPCSPT